MKKNGFTTIELISTFALTMVIALLLFELVLSLKQVYINAGVKSILLNKQVIMTEKLYNDFNTKKIIIANSCGNNCLTFIFNDYSKSTLKIDKQKKLFTYGDYTIKLDSSSNFGDIAVENKTINGVSSGKNNSIIKIQVPITNNVVTGNYGINVAYQYDSRTTALDKIEFTNEEIKDRIYLKGANKIYVEPNGTYTELGYYTLVGDIVTENDNRVIISGVDDIDTTTLGTYNVTYNFYINNQLVDTVTRKVVVGEKPALSGATYEKPGATDTHKGIVYFNPANLNEICNIDNAVSQTEVKEGCMKWYIYDDSDDTYKLMLGHNTTAAVKYNSGGVNTSMLEVAEALNSDITNWDSVIKETARLITADEIAKITGHPTFNSETTKYNKWFYFDTNGTAEGATATTKSKYAWLYDNIAYCTNNGCNIEDNNQYKIYGETDMTSPYGYWTSSKGYDSTTAIWMVNNTGALTYYEADNNSYGVRPVISVAKTNIEIE